jgi:anaerobic magnesium-protoporphyrin IX monomethyl ester cyclase
MSSDLSGKMKIILINPRSRRPEEIQQKCFPPVNLLYLAASLLRSGYDVDIIDANAFGLPDGAVVRQVAERHPELIGISLLSETMIQTCRLTERLKAACPRATLMLGGPHANARPEDVLKEFAAVDLVLTGECEERLVTLARTLEHKGDIGQIPGLYCRQEGKIIGRPAADLISDLDGLPPPARHLLSAAYQADKYYLILEKARPMEILLTSRSCPLRCAFCSNIPGTFRARSPENVVAEIVDRHRSGVTSFDIADANFTHDPVRAMRIFDLIIREKIRISFRFKSRTTAISPELVNKARQAGAYLVSMGMESGSQEVLRRMNKKTRIETNIDACQIVMKAGLKLNTGWIIGFPGETRETIRETTRLILAVKPTTASILRLIPYPGTAVYEEAKAENRLIGDWSVNRSFTPWIKLPWTDSVADLDRETQRVINKVYLRPYYFKLFAGEILRNANGMLAKYAVQEAIKAVRGVSA